jgi:hypothetical protein
MKGAGLFVFTWTVLIVSIMIRYNRRQSRAAERMNSFLEAVPGLLWNRYSILVRQRILNEYIRCGGDPATVAEFKQAAQTMTRLAVVWFVVIFVVLMVSRTTLN